MSNSQVTGWIFWKGPGTLFNMRMNVIYFNGTAPGYGYSTTHSHILVNVDFTWQSILHMIHYTGEIILRVTEEEMQHMGC